jgi:hypothetical protein
VLKIKGKPEIKVGTVEIAPEGRTMNIYGFFPRGQNGNPVIEEKDGEVEVSLKIGNTKINRKFKLKDMVYNGKLEI